MSLSQEESQMLGVRTPAQANGSKEEAAGHEAQPKRKPQGGFANKVQGISRIHLLIPLQ